jgi:hypothetical protein
MEEDPDECIVLIHQRSIESAPQPDGRLGFDAYRGGMPSASPG